MHITWLGHSTVLAQVGGCYILTDPVWCYRVFPVDWMGPARFMRSPLEIEELPRVDIVLLSHTHYDHFVNNAATLMSDASFNFVHSRISDPLGG
jgi:N-acyl-phosphatidylethanolamine-hydrolysing phospholipase D